MTVQESKTIIKTLNRACSICGRRIRVSVLRDRSYYGGHFFGRVPQPSKKAVLAALKAGTVSVKMGSSIFEVFKQDPKNQRAIEYWECNTCYQLVKIT